MKGCLSAIGKFFAFWIIATMLAALGGGLIGLIFGSEEEDVAPADGFEINAYNVILDVQEDNEVKVTEEVTVNFTSAYKHGIYKFTPEWLEYTGKDGKTIKRKSEVMDYVAIGDPYVVDTVKKKERIKIGSASSYVEKGEKVYTIQYTYDMGKDPFNGFDEFIFHAFGDYWGTEIKNASIKVIMPDDIEGYDISFFSDKYRNNDITDYMDYEVNDNILVASYNPDKYNDSNLTTLKKSLTVDIELPEGYFSGGSWNYGYGSLICIGGIIVLTIFCFIRWKRFGKDFPKRAKTVEFYAPEGYSSAEIGYIYKKQSNKKLTISLIIQLASKGYIKIDTKDDDVIITNLIPAPLKPSMSKFIPKRIMKLKKLKEIDAFLDKDAKSLMDYLFKNGPEKELKTIASNFSTIADKFFNLKDQLVGGGYVQIVSDNEKEVAEKTAEYNVVLAEYDKLQQKHLNELKKMPKINELETIVYDWLFNNDNEVILRKHRTFYHAFEDVEEKLDKKLKDLVDDKISKQKRTMVILSTIATVILYYLSYKVIEDLDPKLSILYTISLICVLLNILFIFIMKRKTQYGEEIIAKVKGFKYFLETVEKEKLESLVNENPHYFYDILPYTYVLDISKKWIEKFEDIPIPEMDMGNYDYNNLNSFDDLYSHVYYPSSSSSSSGGCSSCGGGCSSCGGGCSSCGGGGSW